MFIEILDIDHKLINNDSNPLLQRLLFGSEHFLNEKQRPSNNDVHNDAL